MRRRSREEADVWLLGRRAFPRYATTLIFSSRLALGGSIAIGIGATAWALHAIPADLVTSPACPGALDAAAAITARVAPRLPLGSALVAVNRLLLLPTLALVAIVLRRWSGSWIAAGAAGVALAAQRLLDPAASPFDPIVMLAAAAILLCERSAVVPRVRVASAGVIGLLLLVRWMTPALPPTIADAVNCLAPFASARHWRAWLDGSRAAIGSAGPYAMALAAIGVYALVSHRRALWLLGGLALLPAVDSQPGQTLIRGFGTLIVVFWVAVSVGVMEIARACRPTIPGRLAAAAFIVMLPIFQLPEARRPPVAPETFGVHQLGLADVRYLLAVLPDRSALVEEDASFSILLRAASGRWQRMGKQLQMAPGDPDALTALAGHGTRVYALPLAQTELPFMGLALTPADLPGISGLVGVRPGGICQPPRARWTDVQTLVNSSSTTLSVVTAEFGADHNVVIYAAASSPAHPKVIKAAAQRTGIQMEVYSVLNPAERVNLEDAFGNDRVPDDFKATLRPYAMRLEFWRASGRPPIEAVELGVVPTVVIVRGSADRRTSELVCPVFPYGPQPIQIRQ